jgi:hypothetical protein
VEKCFDKPLHAPKKERSKWRKLQPFKDEETKHEKKVKNWNINVKIKQKLESYQNYT